MCINDFTQCLWIFAFYSFIGWCLEVVFCTVSTGELVNRGFLNGTVCPIYGFGAVILILCLERVQDNLLILYLGSVFLGSLLELIGGFLLKKLFHMSWWDYSDEPLNIGGYVCLKFSLAWGIAGVILMRVIHPLVIDAILLISFPLLGFLLIIFYAIFVIDIIVTVSTILKLNRDLQEIAYLSSLIQKNSDKIAEGIGNTALFAADKIKGLDAKERRKELTENLKYTAKENREKLNNLLNNSSILRSRMFKAFPRLKNIHNNNALHEMKLRIEEQIKNRRKKD